LGQERRWDLSAAIAAAVASPGSSAEALDGKKSFAILHINDMHPAFFGMRPSTDCTSFALNAANPRGGFARPASQFS